MKRSLNFHAGVAWLLLAALLLLFTGCPIPEANVPKPLQPVYMVSEDEFGDLQYIKSPYFEYNPQIKRIVFVRYQFGFSNLYLTHCADDWYEYTELDIIASSASYYSPSQIAYCRDGQVYLTDFQGSFSTPLALAVPGYIVHFVVSPDFTCAIVLFRGDFLFPPPSTLRKNDIYLYKISDGSMVKLNSAPRNYDFVRWNPSSSKFTAKWSDEVIGQGYSYYIEEYNASSASLVRTRYLRTADTAWHSQGPCGGGELSFSYFNDSELLWGGKFFNMGTYDFSSDTRLWELDVLAILQPTVVEASVPYVLAIRSGATLFDFKIIKFYGF